MSNLLNYAVIVEIEDSRTKWVSESNHLTAVRAHNAMHKLLANNYDHKQQSWHGTHSIAGVQDIQSLILAL